MTSEKIKVGVLGATGTVGQRFLQLLANHPYFEVSALGASSRSAGKSYSGATNWKISSEIPSSVASMAVHPCSPEFFNGCRIIFSGLDASVAGEIESAFAKSGFCVFSNAKNHRMDPIVPLIVPLANTSHFDVIPKQRVEKNFGNGFLVTNANCSTTGMVVALKALAQKYKLSKIAVTTMQAISGAGYPGVASLDIFDNVVPYIGGEEEKMEIETCKILGSVNSELNGFEFEDVKVSAQCNRVPVLDGHLECVSVTFKDQVPSLEEIEQTFKDYVSEPETLKVPSAPKNAIVVRSESDRPQPRLDRDNNGGNCITVGRIRKCNVFDVKFVVLVHNTILGAAGSSIMNAEVAVAKGLV